jgi:hypothetical protein
MDGFIRRVQLCCCKKLDGEMRAAIIVKLCPASGGNMGTEAKCIHFIMGQKLMAFFSNDFLGTIPEGGEWTSYSWQESGFVEMWDTIIVSSGDLETFLFQFSVVGC